MDNSKLNIRELAKIAGVSTATVSRALQDPPSGKVSESTRLRIIELCDELQYYPNAHTVRMLSRKANTVAFVFPASIGNSDYSLFRMDPNLEACIKGVEQYLTSRGIYLVLVSVTERFCETKEYLKIFRNKMIDGMLIWGWTKQDTYLYELIEENVPLVMIQTEAMDVDVDRVVATDYDGVQSVVEYVYKNGHRKIAVARPQTEGSAGAIRYEGIISTLKQHGVEPTYITEHCAFDVDGGYKAGCEIFDKSLDITCIIAANDLAAYGILEAAKKRDIQIPEDVSLTGADGLKQYGCRQLTTYISPSYHIGGRGAELLLDKIENFDQPPQRICLPTKFVEGETVSRVL